MTFAQDRPVEGRTRRSWFDSGAPPTRISSWRRDTRRSFGLRPGGLGQKFDKLTTSGNVAVIVNTRTKWASDTGFTVLETLIVVAVGVMLATTAVAGIGGAMRRYRLTTGIQTVGAQIGAARYEAVAKNRTMRVRFNCPGPNQLRVIEVVNNPIIDNDENRCSEQDYPFPDQDPGTAPNADGPVVWLPEGTRFEGFRDLEVRNTGRVTPLTGCPACAAAPPPAAITVTNGYEAQIITVSSSGQVQVP